MAEDAKPVEREPGAPTPKDQPDPDLIKLKRARPKIGLVTAAGVVFLSVFFVVKLNADRRFAGHGESPTTVAVADILRGAVDADSYIAVDGEPLMSHAVRTGTDKYSVGMRVVPVRGTAEKLWLVLPGDGWADPAKGPYIGRLRALDDLPLAQVLEAYVAAHPRPVFATANAVRAGWASSKVTTVAGDTIEMRDNDKVGFDVVDPNAAVIVCTYNENHPDQHSWLEALAHAGITVSGPPHESREQVRFDVELPGAASTVATKLEAHMLWAARVDPVTRHYETTWGALKASGAAGFTVPGATIPDAQLDLIGLYTQRAVATHAYALILGEHPQEYWYVLPVTIVMAVICLVFLWSLVRTVKRDLLPTRA